MRNKNKKININHTKYNIKNLKKKTKKKKI